MKIALCCIGRLENRYAVEFVEWYKKLGVDKIFIYDNNYDGEEHFEDVLQKYIDDGLVDIIDYRNKSVCQLSAYQDCYDKHNNEYDWICFFDFDEFLVLVENKDIKQFISNFEGFQLIKINWMTYTDNDMLDTNGDLVNNRLTKPADYDVKVSYDFPENNHIKSIVKCGINNFVWRYDPHVPHMNLKCCNAEGKECAESPFEPYSFKKAFLKHFTTKTIGEYLRKKMKIGTPDVTYEHFINNGALDRFFKINKITKSKINYIKNQNKLNLFIGTYKDFVPLVFNEAYKVIYGNHELKQNDKYIKCASDEKLDDKFYSELYMLKNLPKNLLDKKYIGFCHYRKYFEFMDNIPDLDDAFSKSEIIVAKPITFKNTVREQYATCHNIEDLYILSGIISELCPNYIDAWNDFLDGRLIFPYNMFIMKSDEFKEYVKFIKSILDKYVEIVGIDIYQRIENNKEKYLKDFSPNNTIEYQYRIGGYLGERLTNLWIIYNHKKIMIYPVIITEQKYNKNE